MLNISRLFQLYNFLILFISNFTFQISKIKNQKSKIKNQKSKIINQIKSHEKNNLSSLAPDALLH